MCYEISLVFENLSIILILGILAVEVVKVNVVKYLIKEVTPIWSLSKTTPNFGIKHFSCAFLLTIEHTCNVIIVASF